MSISEAGAKTYFRRERQLSFWNQRCYFFVYRLCGSFLLEWNQAWWIQNVCLPPATPHLVLTVWGQALKVLVKTYIVSGGDNSLNVGVPLSFFFVVRAPWESNESWPHIAYTHINFSYSFGLFLDLSNPSMGQFQVTNPCSVIIIARWHTSPHEFLRAF